MNLSIKYVSLWLAMAAFAATACNKHEAPTGLPLISTGNVSSLTAISARCEGIIITNGATTITASGLCWSKTNHLPTIVDDTTRGTAAVGSFVNDMTNLQPGTHYYVRAYATSTAGTGYGNVNEFTTLTITNQGPEARNIHIAGTVKAEERIVARYTYFDAENNPESGTGFQWYIADDSISAMRTPISGATDSAYVLTIASQNKFLLVRIKPGAGAGTSPGNEYSSYWIGPVAAPDPTTITFTYNGQQVTYGIITSATTGRKWLDRNLGAPNAPTAYNDWQNEGDLFQWGRSADGHQLISRAATSIATTGVNGTTTTLSTSDNPGHALFILSSAAPFDWRGPQNSNLWKLPSAINNACPTGWHVPTKAEWEAENLGVVQDAYTKLKITLGGFRAMNDGTIGSTTIGGNYWSSTTWDGGSVSGAWSYYFSTPLAAYSTTNIVNGDGISVRCIKD